MVIEQGDTNENEQAQVKEHIEMITAFADTLLALGQRNIYDTAREVLIKRYGKDTVVTDGDVMGLDCQERQSRVEN